jgi:hypothetical protein
MMMALKLVTIAALVLTVTACVPYGPRPVDGEGYYSPDTRYNSPYEESYPGNNRSYYGDRGDGHDKG